MSYPYPWHPHSESIQSSTKSHNFPVCDPSSKRNGQSFVTCTSPNSRVIRESFIISQQEFSMHFHPGHKSKVMQGVVLLQHKSGQLPNYHTSAFSIKSLYYPTYYGLLLFRVFMNMYCTTDYILHLILCAMLRKDNFRHKVFLSILHYNHHSNDNKL